MVEFIFVVIAALGLLAALGTVLSRNLVHAALFLVAFFFTIACMFVLLEAEFLAALQVLVYIGAVAIILMFGIMLTRNIQGDDTTIVSPAWRTVPLAAGFCVFGLLVIGIYNESAPAGRPSWSESSLRPSIAGNGDFNKAAERREAVNNMAKAVGDELMTRYVVAFEVAGLLLTVALVGAIALAHREEDKTDALAPGEQPALRSAAPVQPHSAGSSLVPSGAPGPH